jgi:hypothetical protein
MSIPAHLWLEDENGLFGIIKITVGLNKHD